MTGLTMSSALRPTVDGVTSSFEAVGCPSLRAEIMIRALLFRVFNSIKTIRAAHLLCGSDFVHIRFLRRFLLFTPVTALSVRQKQNAQCDGEGTEPERRENRHLFVGENSLNADANLCPAESGDEEGSRFGTVQKR